MPAGQLDPDRFERWVEISVDAMPGDADAVADALSEIAPGGVALHPAIRVDDDADFRVEEISAPTRIAAAVPAPFGARERARLEQRLAALVLTSPIGPVRVREVATTDWAEEWKRFYTLQRIGARLVVHPSWEPYEARPGEAVVALDPGMAFGTGQHETTRLCLAALEALVVPGAEVLDVGTGSGVLAIAALKLGAVGARALDIDPRAVDVTRENAERNGVAERLVAATGSLGAGWPWPEPSGGSADLVLANISATVIEWLMTDLILALRPGGHLVLSGFIARDADAVTSRVRALGAVDLALTVDGDWRCLTVGSAAG